MKKDIFFVSVDGKNYPVSTDLPIQPGSGKYDVWQYGELIISYSPDLEKPAESFMELTTDYVDKKINEELIQKIKMQIVRQIAFYL